ncbi:MAG: mechanosensitive ion channel [Proteobacteria bacterium]|nr:MAG: mechanosensitive ion channel [Pseudomonadota bacterium]
MDEATKTKDSAVKFLNDLQEISFTKIALILLGAVLCVFVVRKIIPYLAKRGPNQMRLYLLSSVPVFRLVVIMVSIAWIIPIVFNVTIQNFLLFIGAASVAIGFAFKDYVSSIIAGIVAIFERPYRPGDWIKIDEDYGEVRFVGIRTLQIVTASDNVITIPHGRIWNSNISNSNDGSRTLMCVAEFFLSPDHDSLQIRDVLRDVAITSAYLLYSKPVLVIVSQTPLGTNYQLKAYPFDMRDQFTFKSDLTIRGKAAIAAVGAKEANAQFAYK